MRHNESNSLESITSRSDCLENRTSDLKDKGV